MASIRPITFENDRVLPIPTGLRVPAELAKRVRPVPAGIPQYEFDVVRTRLDGDEQLHGFAVPGQRCFGVALVANGVAQVVVVGAEVDSEIGLLGHQSFPQGNGLVIRLCRLRQFPPVAQETPRLL